MRRFLPFAFFISLLGLGSIPFLFPEWFESPAVSWILSKFSFVAFLGILLVAAFFLARIAIRTRKAIGSQNAAIEVHLRKVLDELVQDSQALKEFLLIDLPQVEERLRNSKQSLAKETFSAFYANWTKIRIEGETAFQNLEHLPLEPDILDKSNSDQQKISEYKDLLNRHTKAKSILERVRSDLSLLKERLSEKGC
ncbi:hypothetical protein CH373_15810 [Leptospira perolatii]|uniref:Uncharacterized protein n=1 Tax=Leptospira perolatii TaxID=2023191 RepID=A0A2M9ZJG6_9LEPT|nr:hypothetical protein [Leptospira perolatii]PJZ68874.1 hypothetical protein CH360_14270 [Leptospira perolatii]PJZ72205.1 hypothetical protein CH373_15810 [Leptospira perolatii]